MASIPNGIGGKEKSLIGSIHHKGSHGFASQIIIRFGWCSYRNLFAGNGCGLGPPTGRDYIHSTNHSIPVVHV